MGDAVIRSLRLAHFADTHLGAGAGRGYQRPVDDPFNPGARIPQRAADVIDAFVRAIDAIIESGADIAIHTGDLFESSQPSASMIDFAMKQLMRLSAKGIPLVVVEGHQSFPAERASGHILQILRYVPRITVVHGAYQAIRIGELPIVIHAVPHEAIGCGDLPTREQLDPRCYNVLAAHGWADHHPSYEMRRMAPAIYLSECDGWFAYIALGHFHRFCQPNSRRRAFYAGAPTMIDWGDFLAGHQFSLNIVDLGGAEPVVTRHYLGGRRMHAYGLSDASGLGAGDILRFLERQTSAVAPEGSYCLVTLQDLGTSAHHQLDTRAIRHLFASAAAYQLVVDERERPWQQTSTLRATGGTTTVRLRRRIWEAEEPSLRADVLAFATRYLDLAEDRLASQLE